MYFESQLLKGIPDIVHGFGTKFDPVPPTLTQIWVDARPILEQVHGVEVATVLRKNQECGKVDALVTKTANPIGVCSADCVPILLARKDGAMVAAVHAGWRGTLGKIVEKLCLNLKQQGESLENWAAAIGPSIGKCCYEVGEKLVNDFVKTFPDLDPEVIAPVPWKLDLAAINAHELTRLGIETIDFIDECTNCSMDPAKGPRFHSYRREGGGTRQWSVIMRSPRNG